jgi:hypothetical protein
MGGGALRGQFKRTITGMTTPAASAATSALLRLTDGRLASEAVTTAAPSGARFSSVFVGPFNSFYKNNSGTATIRLQRMPFPLLGD